MLLRLTMFKCKQGYAGSGRDSTGRRAAVGDPVLRSRLVRTRDASLRGISVVTLPVGAAEEDWRQVTILMLRYQRGHFTISGPDVEFRKFETRREARDWCAQNYPGSPIKEHGAAAAKRAAKARKRQSADRLPWPV
jgi:hypothetical protein